VIPGSAVGAIHRLAFVLTEDDAQALIAEAIRRGATPEDADVALKLWRTARAAAVHRLGGDAA
jgi:hypothetical protein